MTSGVTTSIRTVLAFAIGLGIDLMLFGDAYPISQRHHHQQFIGSSIGINFTWLIALAAFLCAFALDFKRRPPGGRTQASGGGLAALDARGLLIPLAIVTGLTITHTVVVIRDATLDPTTHNLLPFEYLIVLVVVGIPALAGSLFARAASWMFSRLQMQ
jgi:hypothetical protein